MLRAMKRGARSLVGTLAPMAWQRSRRPRLVILTYHRVFPDDHEHAAIEQPGMRVRPETFAMHLEALRQHFELVDLEDWLLAKVAGESLPARACAITFDDGWRDNYQYAFPILQQAKAPATVFVVTDLVGTSRRFWPNRLAELLRDHWTGGRDSPPGWPPELRELLAAVRRPSSTAGGALRQAIDEAIEACKGRVSDEQMIGWLDAAGAPHAGASSPDLLTWEELETMVDSGLVKVGSHTARHVRFSPGVPPALIESEVGRAVQALSARFQRPSQVFCYPNGDYSPDAERIVARYHAGAVTTNGGWNDVTSNPYRLRRVNIHEGIADSRRRFLATIAAVL